MAIAPMQKVMIVAHRSQAVELLQTLQQLLQAEVPFLLVRVLSANVYIQGNNVWALRKRGNILKLVLGQNVGTLISGEEQ